MTNHYREAEELLRLAGTHTDTGDKLNEELAALYAARAQAHATLALAARPAEQTEPETVPLSDAYAAWGDCIVRERNGDLAQIGEGCHIWLALSGEPVSYPNVYTTQRNRTEPMTLVARLAPWPVPEPEAVPLWRAAETWGDDIEVQSVRFPNARWHVRGGKFIVLDGGCVKWHDLTEASDALVTLSSREPYRDNPWAPGQDVTDRLAAGETAPEGTILADPDGYLYRIEANGRGTLWRGHRWSPSFGYASRITWMDYAPIRVATPEQIRAAGVEVQS